MSRGLDATTTTALAQTITQPYFLVFMDFATPVRYSTRGNITWDSNSWVDAGIEINMDPETPVLSIFNEGTTFGATVLADGTAGRAVEIYYGDKGDSAHPNPVMIFDGEMGEATIGERVVIRCKRLKPLKTPRHFIAPPTCNHIPSPDTRFEKPKEVGTLKRRLSNRIRD